MFQKSNTVIKISGRVKEVSKIYKKQQSAFQE